MDLDVALQKASEDEGDSQYDEVYPGRVLKGENTPGSAKIRYIRGCREPKTFARYTSSLKNMIPLRPSHKHDRSSASRVDESGLFSFITFSWIFPYLWAAFRGHLSQDQVWNCSIYDASSVNLARLEYLWKQELLQRPNRPSLFRVVCVFLKTRICVACFVFLLCLLFGFIGPVCFVKGLISFAEQPPLYNIYPNLGFGIFLAFAILIVETVRVLLYGATWAVSYRTGIRVRGALLALLYKKLISVRSLGTKSGAEIINIFANDGQRLLDAVSFAPLVLVGPLVLIAGIIYLLTVIGPWSLLGILTFIVFDSMQIVLGKMLIRFRASAIKKTEKRINLLGEIIRCIRLIKMNAWEESFTNAIKEMRRSEKIDLRRAGLAQSLTIALGSVVPIAASVFTFLGLLLSGGNLLAGDAFSTITVFFIMMFALRMIPYGSRYCAEAFTALKRIQELLLYPEYDQQIPFCQDANIAVQFRNATFLWDNKSQANEMVSNLDETSERSPVVANEQSSSDSAVALKNITLNVRKNELLGICGPVGSGKTALLSAIVGHLVPKDGSLDVSGQAAFVTQTPWILNRTVQSNILFGLPMNTSRYYKAITVCELTKDLETMKAGDQTERGVTISGGQKTRISLARALFANCRIYLLDDIFASLDRQVADRIFKRAIKEMLANRTVLMVTTDIQRLSKCDRVCYMEGGEIKAVGTHDELLEKCEAYALYCERSIYSDDFKSISETAEEQNAFGDDFVKIDRPNKADEFAKARAKMSDEFQVSTSVANLAKSDGQLVMDEENFGSSVVSWATYKQYIDAADGRWIWVILLLAFVGNVVASIFSTAWLSQWLKYEHSQQIVNISGEIRVEPSSIAEREHTSYYAIIYGFSVIILFVSGLLKALIFVHVSLNAASKLHNRMFDSVMRGSIRFFDTTPSGRILNRFSKDMDEVDVKLPFTVEVFLQNSLTCVGFLIMIAWVFPSFLLPCIFLFCIFTIFILCFRAGITSFKRCENISRSPLFDHISASMEGIQTIHSLGQTDDFIETLKSKLDLNSGAMFMYQSAMRWLAVWLDLLVVAITFIVALLIVLLTGSIAPTDAGMALVFALQMSGIFQFAVRTQTELEAKMTCVERITYYIDHIESENDWKIEKDNSSLSSDCPVEGSIVFREVTVRYRPNLPLALDDVSFRIEPKEKVGIIGRTGSGKTSLCNVLYRLYPLTSGIIEIGGININHIELYRLRRAMAVIPQDPTLFVGTIRFNVDPNNEFTDDQIWMSLEKTYLKDMVSSLDQKLDSPITEGGRNISVGERQLFCMARALLRRVRIVVLDEATGSLDNVTDRHIQKCLREAFVDCTVMIIAHRLENVLGLDKILHMKQGKIVEYDTVQNLMKDENHPLRRLLDDQKLLQALELQKEQSIKKIAENSDEASKTSINESGESSPEHVHPNFAEASGKTSPETSEFEKISDSIDKEITTMSNDNSDLEVINKSDAESNY